MSSRPSTMTLTGPGAMRLLSTKQLLALPPPEWQIDTVFPEGGLVALYGRPGSGKTFLALDMALSVATGHPWQGRRVQQGYVLYVSAEGGAGIGKRVQTWLDARNVTPAQAKVAWLVESFALHNESDQFDRLMYRITEINRQPALIVVDTLARCFAGDENQQEDMGRFVAGIDRMRMEWGATALVVHHTRLDGERERGNTAFRGAADTMLSVTRKGEALTLECNKQKDGAEFEPMTLRLLTVTETDSCVIEEPVVQPTTEDRASIALTVLKDNGGTLTWADWLSATGWPKTTFGRVVAGLRGTGQVIVNKGVYSLRSQ